MTERGLTAKTICCDAVDDDVTKDKLIAEDRATPAQKKLAKKKRA